MKGAKVEISRSGFALAVWPVSNRGRNEDGGSIVRS